MDIFNKRIVLASNSPRRHQLLSEAGFNFEVKAIDVDETHPAGLEKASIPEFLAIKKAEESKAFLENADLLITADTVVYKDGIIFEKPKDEDEAIRMLNTFSGNMHEVITGVCVLTKKEKISFSTWSKVFFRPISEEEIYFYVKKYKPYDKAGAYAIQEWIGLCKIEKIEGTYANVMGLPMQPLYEVLQKISF